MKQVNPWITVVYPNGSVFLIHIKSEKDVPDQRKAIQTYNCLLLVALLFLTYISQGHAGRYLHSKQPERKGTRRRVGSYEPACKVHHCVLAKAQSHDNTKFHSKPSVSLLWSTFMGPIRAWLVTISNFSLIPQACLIELSFWLLEYQLLSPPPKLF